MGFARRFADETTENSPTPLPLRERFCISDDEALKLASLAIKIEDHYSAIAGKSTPMDIEWAKDGEDGLLYIVQARPITAIKSDNATIESYRLTEEGRPLVTGKAVGMKIASGRVRIVRNARDLEGFEPGEILVTTSTSPDWQPVMKKAAGIVTDRGGRTCHAAIVARELGVPAVVGTGTATQLLKTGDVVTVSCANSESGVVYSGLVPFDITRTPVGDIKPHKTEVMINLGDPAAAFRAAALPSAGVGLARMEFVISDHIGIHPMALIHPEKVSSTDDRLHIAERIRHEVSGPEFFIRRLAEGVGKIAAAFYPRPVIIRLSDFKTNEYAQLLGGSDFEPKEANPMLGFRGAARYTHPAYADGFALECEALRRVRDQMGLTNLRVMVPFCRTVREAKAVVAALAKHGLKQGKNGVEIFVMCEIPNNVIQIDAFAQIFDGFSIGSNDLTQLTLGVDRDSDIVAFDFDERDPGMLEMLRLAVSGAKRNGRHVGICGEAPADYPEIARYLVGLGINSISVNPASVLRTIEQVCLAEHSLKRTRTSDKGVRQVSRE
jgi:pyruvate,water dikinase